MSKTVIRIEPESLVPEKTAERKLRVAGYARVSTDSADQLNSYEAQLDYYVRMIKNHDNWIFVNMYSDEGISGTSTLNRPGFLAMIDDALSGKIDLIITKSVSRFARNTVDSLTAIRKLKQHNVEVFFEKENIWTFDSKGELLITIMSSIAQEESRSISENIRWGIRKSFSDGKVEFSQYKPYGYLTEDGKVTIREKEADVVRFIFHSSFEGWSFRSIVRFLNEEDIPSTMEMAWSLTRLLLQRLNDELIEILKRKNTVVNTGEYAPSSELGTMVLQRYESLEDLLPLSELPESLITALFSKIIVARE